MTQVSFTEVSLSDLVVSSPVIVEVRVREPVSTFVEIKIHADSKKYPPFKQYLKHYTVISVLKGDNLGAGVEIDVLDDNNGSSLENHKSYYLNGLGVSPHYQRYRATSLNSDATSRIIFIESCDDGRFEFVMFGAEEDISMRSRIEENLDESVEHTFDDPFCLPIPTKHRSAKSVNEARYPLVEPDSYKCNELIRRALQAAGDFQGIKLYAPPQVTLSERCLCIAGFFQSYVNCGSQLSMWSLFPRAVSITVLDILSGEEYKPIDLSSMNVSWTLDTIDRYSRMPCDQIVHEYFSYDLFGCSDDLPLTSTFLEVRASYWGFDSEPLQINIDVAESEQGKSAE